MKNDKLHAGNESPHPSFVLDYLSFVICEGDSAYVSAVRFMEGLQWTK